MANVREYISEKGKYYLYRHIRSDKNEPFYIGIGTKSDRKRGFISIKAEYGRAYSNHKGSHIFQNIVAKTDYEVEILLESDDYEFIKQKEIEFIALYGRINNDTGCLSNLTDGGNGSHGIVVSQDTRKKIGENNWLKGKFGYDNPKSKTVYQYDLEGNFIREWGNSRDACIELGFPIQSCVVGKSFNGFQWFHNYRSKKTSKYEKVDHRPILIKKLSKKVFVYNVEGSFIGEFTSYKEVERKLGIQTARVSDAISKETNYSSYHFFFNDFQGDKISNSIPKNVIRKVKRTEIITGHEVIFDNIKEASAKTFGKRGNVNTIIRHCKEITKNPVKKWRFEYA